MSDKCRVPPLRCVRIGLLLALIASPVLAADPLTLFLLRILRDQVVTSAIESGVGAAQAAPRPAAAAPEAAPAFSDDGQRLRRLIDESFVHLSQRQREELHTSLRGMLEDPKNAAVRSDILAEFTRQAVAMRDAHRHLAQLTEADMNLIAADARVEFAKLPPDQRQQMLQALRAGVPGMPRAFSERVLTEFASVPDAR